MNSTGPSLTAPVRPNHGGAVRQVYLDNLRAFLTILVILHHLAITYGASGSWYYEEERASRAWAIAGTTFTAFNQFYFMGLFFMLAGYFNANALDRKNPAQFLKDRFVRLGIPLVLYVVFISPWLTFLPAKLTRNPNADFGVHLHNNLPFVHAFSPGPLWFVQALLIFSLCHLFCRFVASKGSSHARVELRPAHLVTFGLVLAVFSFAVRLVYPIGKEFWHMQLAFFPQYILLFGVGIQCHHKGWLPKIPASWLPWCLRLSCLALVSIPIQIILSLRTSPDLSRFEGGLHWEAVALALTEAVVCTTTIPALIILFRSLLNGENRISSFLVRNAYIAYIIHAPVCVAVALGLKDLDLHAVLKFLIATLVALPLTFLFGHAIRNVPGVKRVI